MRKPNLNSARCIIFGNGVSEDDQKAREWFEKAAAQGNAWAQVLLGAMYHGGKGGLKDYQKAREWYEKAADQGNALAQLSVGLMYEDGRGVRQDYATAKEWYGKACDNGDQEGCDKYAELNKQGY